MSSKMGTTEHLMHAVLQSESAIPQISWILRCPGSTVALNRGAYLSAQFSRQLDGQLHCLSS
ncbi:unnamed protein product [Larinioides sclopetarius]|uniref:Uncharacterized protein n=1 Tax=Larinioides sclopetarius TaxID=280406 RepID=A0AAV1Z2Z7_9ARAC